MRCKLYVINALDGTHNNPSHKVVDVSQIVIEHSTKSKVLFNINIDRDGTLHIVDLSGRGFATTTQATVSLKPLAEIEP